MIKGKFKNRKLKITLISIASVIGVLGVTVGSLMFYGNCVTYGTPDDSIKNNTGLVQTYKNGVYDKDGNVFRFKGINAGNLFVQEGWLSPFSAGYLKNEDGSIKKDADGNIQYPEFAQETFLDSLKNNPNCGEENLDKWLNYYYESWWTEHDFINVKNLGFNTIRLPFYWRQILNDDLTLKEENVAFEHLDKFIEGAKKHDLYIVLDLHGCPGSQNGYEHSGVLVKEAKLWHNQKYIDATVRIWDSISKHYATSRSDLSSTIAVFDLMNEPTYDAGGFTEKPCWDVFDKIYDQIRSNNDKHVISMEGCWGFNGLPNPKDYGWENVIYQYHFYNWFNDVLTYPLYNTYNAILNIGRWYEVPTLIGEFTFFNNKDFWKDGLHHYDKNHFSWTIWNYKTTIIGDWDNSWGLYNARLNLDKSKDETKCDVRSCTFETYKSYCDKVKTGSEFVKAGFLKETMEEYFLR